jgi:hypothetical protein
MNACRSLRSRLLLPFLTVALSAPLIWAENPKIPSNPTLTVADRTVADGLKKDFTAVDLKDLVGKGQLREYDSGPVIIYGEHSGDQGVWQFKGVRLLELVKLATGYQDKMDNALYKKRKGLYLAAYAADGYSGVFSWAELLFTPTGALTLVAYDWKRVKAANAGERPPFVGDLVLVAPTDTFSGAREIQALKIIELRTIGEPSK